ncbi:hypothetical protein SAMN00120144_3223 [Hymenobacter roseosalivarius DSM 11622]|uniref:Uncharacterized protein n=1 Tax=Hymenobacter roseosalivarius DSM 11622 TaxID=645990 RepID=A0A1W1W4M6_9BACT|nr:hypothetical protein SAMN00120144_3223 [Hymenobacter roseosalivarius DSM 11622]
MQFRKASQQPNVHMIVTPLTSINSRNVLLRGMEYKWDSTHRYNARTAEWFGLAEIKMSDARLK